MTSEIILRFSEGTGPLSWLIRARNWGRFSHVDIFDAKEESFVGALGTKGGVIRYDGAIPSKHFVTVSVPVPDQAAGMGFLNSQIGKPYDYGAIIGFIFRADAMSNKSKWFCSELAMATLIASGLQPLPDFAPSIHRISPTDLARMLALMPGIQSKSQPG